MKNSITKLTIAFLCITLLLTGCATSPQSTQSGNITASSSPTSTATQENAVEANADTNANNQSNNIETDTSSNKNTASGSKKSSSKGQTLSVHFIDVGQGDSMLITIGSHAMLIDAGGNDKGTAVQLYLKKQGIKTLDYVIGTHPDADHIGGLDVIIYKFNCKKILMPDYKRTTATYRDVISSIKSKNYSMTHPKVGKKYTLGNASFTITGPVKKYDATNDNSISLRLTYKNNSFLFTGDTTKDAEPDVISHAKTLKADVLKIAHHASKYSTTSAFFSAVNPQYAVISCSEDNSYGFPSARVLNLLRSNKVKTFRTDEQGSIIATSNGNKITWNTSPSTTWKAGENTQNSSTKNNNKKAAVKKNTESDSSAKNATYVINENTQKFHLTSCPSVKQMSVKNIKYSKKSRNTLISEGYSPCKNCNP